MPKTTPPEQAPDHVSPVPTDADAALAQRIKEARESRQLTQQAVATRSKWADPEGKGISRTALIGYEAGTSRPGARELRILCHTLVVSPNKLLLGEETPVRTTHPALETTPDGWTGLRFPVELAFVLAALKGHERDALASLALSLAGRQLGDARLGALRDFAGHYAAKLAESLRADIGDSFDARTMSLEQLADALTRGSGSNHGNNLQFDEDGNAIGQWLYPDPRPTSPSAQEVENRYK